MKKTISALIIGLLSVGSLVGCAKRGRNTTPSVTPSVDPSETSPSPTEINYREVTYDVFHTAVTDGIHEKSGYQSAEINYHYEFDVNGQKGQQDTCVIYALVNGEWVYAGGDMIYDLADYVGLKASTVTESPHATYYVSDYGFKVETIFESENYHGDSTALFDKYGFCYYFDEMITNSIGEYQLFRVSVDYSRQVIPVTPMPSPTVVSNWSKEELNLIDTYLYGYEIPVPEFKGNYKLRYDEDYGELMLEVLNITREQLEAYADNYGTELNYNDEYDVYYLFEEIDFYGLTRNVYLTFYLYNEDDESGKPDVGDFVLEAYDPYYYDWPGDIVDEFLSLFDVSAEIPSYDADYYELVTASADFGMLIICAYTDASDAEETYRQALLNAGYTISDELDDYGYYISYSPNGLVEVDFKYDAKYRDLDIYIYILEQPVEIDPELEAAVTTLDNLLFEGEGFFQQYDEETFYTGVMSEQTTLVAAVKEFSDIIVDNLVGIVAGEIEEFEYDDGTPGTGILLTYGNVYIEIDAYETSGTIIVQIVVFIDSGSTPVDPDEGDPVLREVTTELFSALFGEEERFYYDDEYETFYFSFVSEEENLEFAVSATVDVLLNSEIEDIAVYAEMEDITFYDGDEGKIVVLAVGENIEVDVYSWLDPDDGIIVEVDVFYNDELNTTGGEGTGEVIVDGDDIIAKLDLTTMSNQATFTSQTVGAITFTSEGGSVDSTYYANGETLRVYYGATFTFSAEAGYEIESIEITLSEDTGGKILDFSSLTWDNAAEVTVEGNVCTVTPIDGTLDVSFFINGTKGHLRISSISATYCEIE